MTTTLVLQSGVNGFAEDKDQAREMRILSLMPALARGEKIVIDFGAVKYATQSYVHALMGEALQRYSEQALDMIEFRHCSAAVKGVIELVVDYSLGGFLQEEGA